jgi:hypothetical protein
MSNKAKIREEAKKLNPIDDPMFRKMAEDKEFCEEILRVILEDDALTVTESIPQWTGTNLQGRSVILDAKCVRGDGSQVDIEVQKADDAYNSKFPKTSDGKRRFKETEKGRTMSSGHRFARTEVERRKCYV